MLRISLAAIVLVCLSVIASTAFTADEAAEAKVSSYASAKDLTAQLTFYLDRLNTDLEDADAYEDEQKGRVAKDANTVAVLGAALGMHDEQHDLKAGAPALVVAAKELAKNAGDHAKASEALKKAQATLKVTSGGGKIGWDNVADLGQLMKQVPIVNNTLRQGVTGNRFEKQKEKTAAIAATLAALAEASAHDDSYCVEDGDAAKWMKICREMRDSSAAVSKFVRAGDQASATKELDQLVKTCDDCHHKFRDKK